MTPTYLEDQVSQLPALKLLISMGWQYISPQELNGLRGGRTTGVLLEPILKGQLRKINKIQLKGNEYDFDDTSINEAIRDLRELPINVGVLACISQTYQKLILGDTASQTIDDDRKSRSMRYINWENISANTFHVAEEFAVSRDGRADTYRPDIVLFVNGIPLVVIECKRPTERDAIGLAIEQHVRNQMVDGIRPLYAYSSLVIALAMNEAQYGTGNTLKKFFAVWKERYSDIQLSQLYRLKNELMQADVKKVLFQDRFANSKASFEAASAAPQEVTEQDKLLYSLCTPARLLEITRYFTVFEDDIRKVARYQQYFVIKRALERLMPISAEGKRDGGVVWHTQGSGKSLTMVMLAALLANEKRIANPKIIVVTDRTDLDKQISETFVKCGLEATKAETGKKLGELIETEKATIITTVINKFEALVKALKVGFNSPDIFILIDEAHRTQNGTFAVSMRKVFSNACFLGFTGTPLLKKEKNTSGTFGGIIEPVYSIVNAVEDKAVVPLLYEGRHSHITVNAEPLDRYFDRVAETLTPYGKEELKRRNATRAAINAADQIVYDRAYDISAHFVDNIQGTGFKAQLVAPDKRTAVKYLHYLKDIGKVSAALVISSPDMREGEDDTVEEAADEVKRFYKGMLDKFGTPAKYEENIISQFKNSEEPEIIIVVDKLLTGFDAPRNQVLYVTRQLRDHTLLQAIARVNRLAEGKDYGYIIDYYGILGNLDEALTSYSGLDIFDEKDLEGTIANMTSEIEKLPQSHAEVWDIFKEIKNKQDHEAYERLLAAEDIRYKFYEKLSSFARLLKLALSNLDWASKTDEKEQKQFKQDLEFFLQLRLSVKRRYSDSIDFKEYEAQVRKLIDKHLSTNGDVILVTPQVNIFDIEARQDELDKLNSPAAKADHIASSTQKTISLNADADPAFAKRMSQLIQQAIDDYYADRITEAEYLKRAQDLQNQYINGGKNDVPSRVSTPFKLGVYHLLNSVFESDSALKGIANPELLADIVLGIDKVGLKLITDGTKPIVDWKFNPNLHRELKQAIDDYLFVELDSKNIKLSLEQIDLIIDDSIQLFKHHFNG